MMTPDDTIRLYTGSSTPVSVPIDAWRVRVSYSYNWHDVPESLMPPWALTLLGVLRSTKYKPWYHLSANLFVMDDGDYGFPSQFTRSFLGLTFRAPDSRAYGEETIDIRRIGRRVGIPVGILVAKAGNPAMVRAWVRSEIHKLESHEADEFLRFGDELTKDPHT